MRQETEIENHRTEINKDLLTNSYALNIIIVYILKLTYYQHTSFHIQTFDLIFYSRAS